MKKNQKKVVPKPSDSGKNTSNPGAEPRVTTVPVRWRICLKFISDEMPALDRIEFHTEGSPKSEYRQSGAEDKTRMFRACKFSVAISLFFLDYLCFRQQTPPKYFLMEGGDGTLAAALGNALANLNGKWGSLFVELPATGGKINRVNTLFGGKNWGGAPAKHQLVYIKPGVLPPAAFEIFWGETRLTSAAEIQLLTERFRQVWKLPPPSQSPIPIGEESQENITPPPADKIIISQPRNKQLLRASDLFPVAIPSPVPINPPAPQADPLPKAETYQPPQSAVGAQPVVQPKAAPEPTPIKTAPEKQPAPEPEYPPPPPIDPQLFTVPETNGYWPDQAPLIELPDEEDNVHAWTLKNAFEGVLILGRTGSGKTSGSGFTFAEAFLRGGFGGLVLTVKKNEAEHWRRLCAHCGREKDLVVVRRGGDWKLNILAYEAQHPGQGAGLSENLTTFCRNLLKISARSQGPLHHEQIWEQAGDQLLNATFDLFLLAGGAITYDRLADFIASAPAENLPKSEADWLKIPVFGSIMAKAAASQKTLEDKRLFVKAQQYWIKTYSGYNSKLRTSITLGIYAMLDAFRGRDVPALISSETNITPESIMAGKIVVLDLPVKELRHTGLMVQSAWKYLFQTALERQHNANSPHRRPVFLWEDEAQYFFSDHDHHFQDTARSSRVCRVILTQNLPGFYKEFGRDGADIANSVFGNLNTKVFHNNSDPTTNEWAAKHFGMEIHTRYSFNHAPVPPPRDFFDGIRQSINPPDTTSVGGGENWEYAVRPEEFNTLRTGGQENDFLVDAWITWMGLSAEKQRHFTLMTFQQNPDV